MDDFETVGFNLFNPNAARRSALDRMRGSLLSRAVRARTLATRGAASGERSVTRAKARSEMPFGLGTVNIGAGGTGQLQVTAQEPFAAHRLILSTTAAAGEVTVTDIKVGTRSILASTGAIPIEAFQNDATLANLAVRALATGQDFTVELSSSAAGAVDVSGMLYGTGPES